jgi:uncharacterized protein YuzB (UPF0349 family)
MKILPILKCNNCSFIEWDVDKHCTYCMKEIKVLFDGDYMDAKANEHCIFIPSWCTLKDWKEEKDV